MRGGEGVGAVVVGSGEGGNKGGGEGGNKGGGEGGNKGGGEGGGEGEWGGGEGGGEGEWGGGEGGGEGEGDSTGRVSIASQTSPYTPPSIRLISLYGPK